MGLSSVASIPSRVDLPAPFGPSSPRIAPARAVKLTRETARRRPKWRDTSSTATWSKSVTPRCPRRLPAARRSRPVPRRCVAGSLRMHLAAFGTPDIVPSRRFASSGAVREQRVAPRDERLAVGRAWLQRQPRAEYRKGHERYRPGMAVHGKVGQGEGQRCSRLQRAPWPSR